MKEMPYEDYRPDRAGCDSKRPNTRWIRHEGRLGHQGMISPIGTSTPHSCLLVGTPCYGRQVTDLYAGSLLKLQLACQRREVRLQVQMLGSDALITRARQNIVARFLENDTATHLIFIDADMGFEPEQVFGLWILTRI